MMIECVPNFSEGRNVDTIDRICRAIAQVLGVELWHRTSDADHHRSVVTFAGSPAAVAQAAVDAAAVAVERIDLTAHAGVHPRIGTVDVIPFVPLSEATLEDCARLARETAEEIWRRLRVPAFLYESAALDPARQPLEAVRRAAAAGAQPDVGEGRHATAGAVAIGARKFLIAWNIILNTTDLDAAKSIARRIRFSSGGLPGVKALGLPLPSRGQVQVSINSTDFEATPLHEVFAAAAAEARASGVAIAGSELIGMIPARALELSEGHDLRWLNFDRSLVVGRTPGPRPTPSSALPG